MLPDVQTRKPKVRLHLTRVGVKDVRKLLKIPRGEKRPIILLANFDCYVDLPAQQKGTHMSRNLEAINEIIEEIVQKPVYELEMLCEDIVKEIFKAQLCLQVRGQHRRQAHALPEDPGWAQDPGLRQAGGQGRGHEGPGGGHDRGGGRGPGDDTPPLREGEGVRPARPGHPDPPDQGRQRGQDRRHRGHHPEGPGVQGLRLPLRR
ncbi:MAG: GTP cyclohydrolase I FolE2 [Euryarchaeota archaeon]|nr:GTP cyclohydrolase I FolE2 [Euryarchaeota archaeon]